MISKRVEALSSNIGASRGATRGRARRPGVKIRLGNGKEKISCLQELSEDGSEDEEGVDVPAGEHVDENPLLPIGEVAASAGGSMSTTPTRTSVRLAASRGGRAYRTGEVAANAALRKEIATLSVKGTHNAFHISHVMPDDLLINLAVLCGVDLGLCKNLKSQYIRAFRSSSEEEDEWLEEA